MYMTLLEFTLLGLYLSLLVAALVTIQMLEERRLQLRVEDTPEKFTGSESFEEPTSEEDFQESTPVEPETTPAQDEYSMTENPMFRHRTVHSEELDMGAVD